MTQNELQEMIDDWWKKNTLVFKLLDGAIDWVTGNMDPEEDRKRVSEFYSADGEWANGVGYLEMLTSEFAIVDGVACQNDIRLRIAAHPQTLGLMG